MPASPVGWLVLEDAPERPVVA